jgi:molybdate transport system substrate-binding protein
MQRALLVVIAVLLAGSCGGSDRREVLVSAASSLTDAFTAIEAEYEARHPDVDIVLNLGGSSSLREQILAGAPVDVFASANQSNVDDLIDAGLIAGRASPLATNQLAIAVPAGNPAGIATLRDLARDDLLIGLCSPSVPCGQYAADTLAGAGVVVSPDTFEPDVRALLTKISAGELDGGIVYQTDIAAAGGAVESIEMPPEPNVTVLYSIALISGREDGSHAAGLLEFVLGPDGRRILTEFGFAAP